MISSEDAADSGAQVKTGVPALDAGLRFSSFVAWGALLIGLALMVFGFLMDPSVQVAGPSAYGPYGPPSFSRVNNAGLLNTKFMLVVAGGVFVLAGTIVLAVRRR